MMKGINGIKDRSIQIDRNGLDESFRPKLTFSNHSYR